MVAPQARLLGDILAGTLAVTPHATELSRDRRSRRGVPAPDADRLLDYCREGLAPCTYNADLAVREHRTADK